VLAHEGNSLFQSGIREVFAPHAVVPFVQSYTVIENYGRNNTLFVQTSVTVCTIEFKLVSLPYHCLLNRTVEGKSQPQATNYFKDIGYPLRSSD
jgi:hypothetical protein